MEHNERFCEYRIAISGDDYAVGNIVLSYDEAEVVRKVLNCLTPTGPYAPEVYFVNMDEARKKEEEARKKTNEENKKKFF